VLNIKFQSPDSSSKSQFGGGAWLPAEIDWPMNQEDGKELLPVLTLFPDFFPTATIPIGMCLTIFLACKSAGEISSGQLARRLAANDQAQYALNTSGSLVLLHTVAEKERFAGDTNLRIPTQKLSTQPFDNQLIQEENEDEINGAERSKLFGRPAWLQDEVFPEPRYEFCLQIVEADILSLGPTHSGIFRDGIAYLFLDRNCRKANTTSVAGRFFVQFT
jgi:hypothetical protein